MQNPHHGIGKPKFQSIEDIFVQTWILLIVEYNENADYIEPKKIKTN